MRALTFRGSTLRAPAWGDALVLGGLAIVLYAAVRSAKIPEGAFVGPHISLATAALPAYAMRSFARMAAAYVLSVGFTLGYGYAAAKNKRAEKVLLPALDVLHARARARAVGSMEDASLAGDRAAHDHRRGHRRGRRVEREHCG